MTVTSQGNCQSPDRWPAYNVAVSSPFSRSVVVPARLREHPVAALWTGFAVVHLVLAALCLFAPGLPMGDVSIVYKEWMREAVAGEGIVGIDSAWVYPILAWAPMAAAWLLGPALYDWTWLGLTVLADGIAFGLLIGWRRGVRAAAAWWWLAFLLLLGPIALGRIDAFTVPLVIIALVWAAQRPVAASVLLTIATWIKVWPAAVLAAALIVSRLRLRMLQVAIVGSITIVLIALTLGSGDRILSFFGDQTSRGLQVEAPVSTVWVWLAMLGVPGARVFYNEPLNTFEVGGAGADAAASLMNPLLAVAVLAILLLGVRALRAGADAGRLLPVLSLAFALALIAFNKVGSPQYVVWLAAPVIAGLVVAGRDFRRPAMLSLAIAGLTQLIYPYLYIDLLSLNPVMVLVLTVRNVLYFVAIGALLRELVRLARPVAAFEAVVPGRARLSPGA